MRRRHTFTGGVAVALVVLAVASGRGAAAPACTITWDGSAGTFAWQTATNWDTNVLPGASDHVCIGSVASPVVYSTTTTSILSLQATGPVSLTGGILNLTDTGNASNVGTFTQSSGTLGGAGALNVATAYNWSGGTMSDAGTTTIAGAATLTQSGFTTLANGRLIENAGTYNFSTDVNLSVSGTAPSVHNTGTISKSAGVNTANVFAALDNDGTVVSNSGTMSLRAGTGTCTGSFGGSAATGTVEFDAGTYTLAGASLPGHVKVAGGTLQVADASTVTVSGANTMSGGTVGGNGTFSLTGGTWTWTGGTMSDAGTTSVGAAAAISQSGFATLANGRLLDNAGSWDFAADVNVSVSGTAPSIHNSGAITKSAGVNTANVFPALDNDGTVVSSSGTLSLRAGTGTGTGSFGGAAATGTVEFDAGTFTLAGVSLPGHVKVAGGTLQVADASTVTASGANSMTAGTVGGTGTFSLTGGTWTWTGGTMSDAGTTSVANGATLSQNGFTTLANGRLLDNAGSWDFTADVNVSVSGTAPSIHNSGAITKSAGVNTANVFPALDNDGSVVSSSGTLSLRAGAGTGTGTFGSAAATGTVSFDGGTFTLAGATMPGHVKVTGSTVQVAAASTLTASGANSMTGGTLGGTGTFAITGGTWTWTGGTMSDAGTTSVANGATLSQNGFTTLANGRLLDNAGTWDFTTDVNVSVSGTAPSIHNTGAITKSAGVNTTSIFPALENDGSVVSQSGTLILRGGTGTGSGSFGGASATGTVSFSAGTFTLAGATLLGHTTLVGATLTLPAAASVTVTGANTFTAGTIGGPGTFNLAGGTYTWTGGTMTDAGTTQIAAPATLLQTGATTLAAGRLLDNAGTYQFGADTFLFEGAAPTPTLHNTGTITKTAGSGEATIFVSLSNAGTVTSTSGRLNLFKSAPGAQAGTFTGASDTAHTKFGSGTFTLGAAVTLGGTVEIGGANIAVPDGQTLAVPNRLLLTSGELQGPGVVNVAGTLAWSGGTQVGPGTTTVALAGKIDVDGNCFVDLEDGRLVENNGTITFLHHSSLDGFGSARSVIDNNHAIVLDDTTGACTSDNELGGDLLVNNTATGTITKSGSMVAGTKVTRIDGEIDNDGVVSVLAGELDLTATSAVQQTGTFSSAGGSAVVGLEDGTFRMGSGVTLAGHTAVNGADVDVLDGATLTVASGDTLSMSSGSMGGDGTFRVLGALDWTGGRHTGNGATVIEQTGTATLDGSSFDVGLDSGRILVNRGSILWTTGDFWAGEGTSVVNVGTLEVQGDSTFGGTGFFGFGSGSLFHNAGLFKKTGSTTVTVLIPTDNDGTIEVDGGRVDFPSQLSQLSQLLNYSPGPKRLTAGSVVVHGATLGLPGGLASNASTVLLDGPGAQLVYVTGFPPVDHDALDAFAANLGAGDVTLDNGKTVTTPGPLRNAGILTLAGSSRLTTTGAYTQTGGITNLAGAASHLTATGANAEVKAGRFGGNGTVGPTLAATGGEVQPGLGATGILHADAFSASGSSTLRIQIGGTTPGSGFDQLAVVGAAALGGTLAIETAPGFQPAAGSSFPIVIFGSRTGTFASVTGLSPGGGVTYDLVYDANDVTLVVGSGGTGAAAASPTEPSTTEPSPSPPSEPAPAAGAASSTAARAPAAPSSVGVAAYDDRMFAVLSGTWLRRSAAGAYGSTFTVSTRRGSTLVRAGVTAKRLTLLATACRGCGKVAVLWNGRLLQRVDLQGRGLSRTRSYVIARFPELRTGTVTLRVLSRGRNVAFDAIVAGP